MSECPYCAGELEETKRISWFCAACEMWFFLHEELNVITPFPMGAIYV